MTLGAIVLLCRNNLAYSKACFKSLKAQTVSCEVLIINNASSDGTGPWARSAAQLDPRVHRVSTNAPQSVSALWNLGLRWAWAKGFEDCLVVNNDIELRPDTYERLKEWLDSGRERQVGLVTGVSAGEEIERGLLDNITESPHPDFSCFMLANWAWEQVGGFDEAYRGAYCEDADYHVRLHRAGIKAVSIDLPFVHHRSATTRTANRQERHRIESNAKANRERFFRTYGAWPGTKGYEKLFA